MIDEHDERLGSALRDLATPAPRPSSWTGLRSALLEANDLDEAERVDDNELVVLAASPLGISQGRRTFRVLAVAAVTIVALGTVAFFAARDLTGRPVETQVAEPGEEHVEPIESLEPEVIEEATGGHLNRDALANLAYPSEWAGGGAEVQLKNGEWASAPSRSGSTRTTISLFAGEILAVPFEGEADNGSFVAAAVLAIDPGGSGTFYQLYWVSKNGDETAASQPKDLGDRIGSIMVDASSDSVSVRFEDREVLPMTDAMRLRMASCCAKMLRFRCSELSQPSTVRVGSLESPPRRSITSTTPQLLWLVTQPTSRRSSKATGET